MDYLKKIYDYKNSMIEDLFKLLEIDSTLIEQPDVFEAPFGEGCKNALLYFLDLGQKMGFKTKNIDNVAGHIEYGEGDEIIALLCHLDVVPADGEWTNPPFKPIIKDGKLFARGAIDDKGPAISSLYAMKMIKDLNIKINKRIRLIIGTDEETGSRGIKRYFEVEEMPQFGFSPDADFPLIYGEKGIMSIDIVGNNENPNFELYSGTRYNIVPALAKAKGLKTEEEFKMFINKNNYEGKIGDFFEIKGLAAHAMEPSKGVNALIRLASFYEDESPLCSFITKYLSDCRFKDVKLDYCDYEMGPLTMNVAVANIKGGNSKVGLNLRYPVRWDKDKFINELTQLAAKENLSLRVISDSHPHYVSPDDEQIKLLMKAYQTITNDFDSKPQTIGGGTYARSLKKGVAFGQMFPGQPEMAHQADEFILVDDLFKSSAIYALALEYLGK